MNDKRIAVLIDAENTSPLQMEAVLQELSTDGQILLKRAYGNWAEICLTPWASEVNRLAIRTFQQFNCASGKNAADIALVIDAMELLHSGLYDEFAIISSDSDYTPLAIKLRESGVRVVGVGKRHTPESFCNACDQFIYLETLNSSENRSSLAEEFPLIDDFLADEEDTPSETTSGLIDDLFLEEDENNNESEENHFWDVISGPDDEYDIVWDSFFVQPPEDEIPSMERIHTLLRLVYNDRKQGDGYARLSTTGNLIKKICPDLNYRDYGFRQLHELLQAFPDRYQVVSHRTASRKRVMAFRCCS